MPKTLWTLGHSNVSLEAFLELVQSFDLRALGDVRSFPASRLHPQFNREALAKSLAAHQIDYRWFPGLGGRRKPAAESPHRAWRVEGFRAYADYMETPEFAAGLDELVRLARESPTAYMCAERLWWQCHRRLISDALTVRGMDVVHILDAQKSEPHKLTDFLRVEDGRLFYGDG